MSCPLWATEYECGPIPESFGSQPCCLGIDEAGRGPVLGPMVYGAAFWPVAMDEEIGKLGFRDSKALTAAERDSLFARLKRSGKIGYVLRVISAREISARMLQKWVARQLVSPAVLPGADLPAVARPHPGIPSI